MVCALEVTHLQRIESVIVSSPLVDPYDVIKDKLLSIYDTSEDENLNQLLNGACLGNRLPSEMLIHMQRLGGNNVGTGLLKKLFLERLPPIVRNIIVATPRDSLTELAQRADRVFVESSHSDSSSAADTSVYDSLHDDLANQVANIDKSLQGLIQRNSPVFENSVSPALDRTFHWNSLSFRPLQTPSYRYQSTSRPRYNSPRLAYGVFGRGSNRFNFSNASPRRDLFNEHNSSNFCFYHFNFGERVRNCAPPCAWKATNASTSSTCAPSYNGNDSSRINSTSCELPSSN